MSKDSGLSPQGVTEAGLDLAKQVLEAFGEGNHLVLQDKDGKLLNTWKTFHDFNSYVQRQMEIAEETEPDDEP